MTAKPSPVSLTPRQQPRSPTPGIYTAAAPRWDSGQGAWLGYLGGDPPPTPKKRKKRLSTQSRPPAPRPSSSRSLAPSPFPSSPWSSRLSLLPSLLPSFPFLVSSSSFCCLSLSPLSLPFSFSLHSLLCLSCPSVSLHSLSPSAFCLLPFLPATPCLSVCLSFLSSFSVLSLSPAASPLSL